MRKKQQEMEFMVTIFFFFSFFRSVEKKFLLYILSNIYKSCGRKSSRQKIFFSSPFFSHLSLSRAMTVVIFSNLSRLFFSLKNIIMRICWIPSGGGTKCCYGTYPNMRSKISSAQKRKFRVWKKNGWRNENWLNRHLSWGLTFSKVLIFPLAQHAQKDFRVMNVTF